MRRTQNVASSLLAAATGRRKYFVVCLAVFSSTLLFNCCGQTELQSPGYQDKTTAVSQKTLDFPINEMLFHFGDTVPFRTNQDFVRQNAIDNIIFRSNIDGFIGNGPSFSDNTLSQGTHLITAYFSHGESLVATTRLQITISTTKTGDPFFSQSADQSIRRITLSIGSTTDNSSIYYTDDGSVPDQSGLLYAGTIHIEKNTCLATILARTFKPQMEAGDPEGIVVNNCADITYRGVDGVIDPKYKGEDLGKQSIRALRPLAEDILENYGNPTDSLNRARALRDWVARTALHPHAPSWVHASDTFPVLPAGTTWTDAQNLENGSLFYVFAPFGHDGVSMLEILLGTLDPVSYAFDNTGAMARVAPGHFVIKDLSTYPYVYCSYQANMLIALLNAIGLQATMISTIAHDTCAVFIPEIGEWIYQDPTFNEEFVSSQSNVPLSPEELFRVSLDNNVNSISSHKTPGPAWDNSVFPDPALEPDATYFNRRGMYVMGSRLNNAAVDEPNYDPEYTQIRSYVLEEYSPFNNSDVYRPVPEKIAFPELGAGISRMVREGDHFIVSLFSTFPGHKKFMRNIDNKGWEECSNPNVLTSNFSFVAYRSLDANGYWGMDATVRKTP